MPMPHLIAGVSRSSSNARLRGVVGGLAVAVATVLIGGAQPVVAHTDIVYTTPAADETVADPVATITVAFADPVRLVGAGFEVFTPQEQIVQPVVDTDDDIEFRLQLDPPLAGGVVGVRYEVVAADGHIIDGAFTFTVAAPAPIPTTAPVPTTATAAPAPTPAPAEPSVPATTIGPPTTEAPAPVSTTEPTLIAPAPVDDDDAGSTGLVIGVLLAAVVAAGAVVILRARTRRAS